MDLIAPGFVATDEINQKAYHAEANVFWQPSKKLNLTAGFSHDHLSHYFTETHSPGVGINHMVTLIPNEMPQSWDLFSQLSYDVFDNFKLIGGLRLHYTPDYEAEQFINYGSTDQMTTVGKYTDDGIKLIPRLAGLWRVNAQHLFKLLYGKALVDISLGQNYNLFNPTLPELTLEEINTTELAYVGTFQNVGVTASIFRNELDNLIVRTNLVDLNNADPNKRYTMIMDNSGKMRTYGAELTVQLRPSEKWQVELSGTYQKTQDKRLDQPAAYSPNFLGYAKAMYQLRPNHTVAASGRYVSSMMPLYDESTQKRLGDTVDGYGLLDANYRWDNAFTKGLFIDLRISNLLNSEIRYPVFSNNAWATRGTLGDDRSFFVTVGMKF